MTGSEKAEPSTAQAPGWSYVVAVEGVEDSGDVAAQDADGNAGVVQRHPAAAGLLWAMAAEQVITHRTQHTQLKEDEIKQSWADEDVWTPVGNIDEASIPNSCAQLLFEIYLIVITANIWEIWEWCCRWEPLRLTSKQKETLLLRKPRHVTNAVAVAVGS